MLVLFGIVTAYTKVAWTLTYLRLTGHSPQEPVVPSGPEELISQEHVSELDMGEIEESEMPEDESSELAEEEPPSPEE